jgi:hypothetical protein
LATFGAARLSRSEAHGRTAWNQVRLLDVERKPGTPDTLRFLVREPCTGTAVRRFESVHERRR